MSKQAERHVLRMVLLRSSHFARFQPIATLGHETINTPVYVQMDLNYCHIMTDYLSRFTLIGEPAMGGKAIKILRLAAFAPTIPSSIDYNIRVYFVEDNQNALEVSAASGSFLIFSTLID